MHREHTTKRLVTRDAMLCMVRTLKGVASRAARPFVHVGSPRHLASEVAHMVRYGATIRAGDSVWKLGLRLSENDGSSG